MNYELLFNPIIISVIILCVLCLCRVNVLLSIILATFTAGLTAQMSFNRTMNLFIEGMGASAETALSYILLGTFAAAMTHTGLAKIISKNIVKLIKNRKNILILILVLIAIASQNLIPVHIAFIPIIIPPLLHVMNKLKIDRRVIASGLAFGLKMPYIVIPAGFGLIFQGLIADYMTQSGMAVSVKQVWQVNWFLGIAMLVGFLVSVFIYRKPREYEDLPIMTDKDSCPNLTDKDLKFNRKHFVILIAALVTLILQLVTGSLPFGAVVGLTIIFGTGVINHTKSDDLINQGILLMGHIAFVMLIAAGFALVLQQTGGIESLVDSILPYIGSSKLLATVLILIIGLFVTMGIGTSFGTIPIMTVLFVPICLKMGISIPASIILISAAAALGDAGSPVSDTTLGPTSGLNADGQHNHISDTCVPTFLHYNIPLMLFAIIGVFLF